MASGSNLTTAAAYLKRTFGPAVIINTVAQEADKGLSLIRFDTNGSGNEYAFTMQVGPNPSGSADFTEAQATGQAASSQAGQFRVPYFDDFSNPTVAGKVIRRSKGKAGAWLEQLKTEVMSSLKYATHRLGVALYTSGYGELAQVSSPGASTTWTLKNKSHIWRFVPGMKIVSAANIASGALRNSGASAKIASVNYSAGTFVTDVNANTVATSDGDWIFTKGDRQDSATPARQRPAGLGYWATTSSATDSDFGVTRSDNSLYQAFIVDNTTLSLPIANALQTAVQYVVGIGNVTKPVIVVSMNNFTELSKQLQGQKLFASGSMSMTGRGDFGYKTLSVFYDGVECGIVVSKLCGDEVAYAGDFQTIVHKSCGEAPGLDDSISDGGLVRQASDDGIEARISSTSTIIVECPAKLAVVKLA
jgi:hypothetical protein